jgi:hypothetical protein
VREQKASVSDGTADRSETPARPGLGFGWTAYFVLRIVSLAGTFVVSYQEQHPRQLVPQLYEVASFPAALSLPFLFISPFAILALRKRAKANGRRVSRLALFDLTMYGLMIAFLAPLIM